VASFTDLQSALKSQIEAALATSGVANITTCLYYPTDDMVKAVAQDGGSPLVAIYLRMSNFKTVSMRYRRQVTDNACGISSTLTDTFLGPSDLELTLSFAEGQTAVQVDDAVSFFVRNGDYQAGASAQAVGGDTLQTLATKLAAAITTNLANQDISASANGAVVTISNAGTNAFYIASNTGNVSTAEEAVQWAYRNYQIIAYTADLDDREAIQGTLEDFLSGLQDGYGFSLTSGEAIRVRSTSSRSGDADVLKDVYRDDFMLNLEHAVDRQSTLYDILMPVVFVHSR
jgi:hypothetical protein